MALLGGNAAAVLAGLIGLVLGFTWCQGILSANMDRTARWWTVSAMTVLTQAGPVALTAWKGVVDANSGSIFVICLLIAAIVRYYVSVAGNVRLVMSQLPDVDRKRVRDMVQGQLFRLGEERTVTEAIKVLSTEIEKSKRETFSRSPGVLHDFIHQGRAVAIKQFAELAEKMAEDLREQRDPKIDDISPYLEKAVELYYELLAQLVDRKGLWVAVRRNEAAGYVTIIRKGIDFPSRHKNSEPTPRDSGLPRALQEDLNSGPTETRGVRFVTPSCKRKGSLWKKSRNDSRKEDNYVMAAPILARLYVNGAVSDGQMVFILYANHTKDVFRPWHRDVVRCCVDTLSTVLSLAGQVAESMQSTENKTGQGAKAAS
jgi:hypothetical protein